MYNNSDKDELVNMFHYACPKFLSPVPPNFDGVTDQYLMEPYSQQLKVFMDEVQQQLLISDIRSFLKLYTTLPISKLASFINKVLFSLFSFSIINSTCLFNLTLDSGRVKGHPSLLQSNIYLFFFYPRPVLNLMLFLF
jgi:hypothetical protein